MDKEDHKRRHEALDASLNELLEDYLSHNKGKLPTETTITELVHWSVRQTIKPDELEKPPLMKGGLNDGR